MKKLTPFMTVMFAVAFLFSVCASSLMAQSNVKSSSKLERERLKIVMDSGTNIEEFRQEYLNYLTELEDDMSLFNAVPAVQQKSNRSGLRPSAMLAAAKTSVSEMSQEDLIKMRSAYAKIPGWREMPQALIRVELRQELEAKIDAKQISGVTIKAATIDDCGPALASDISNTDISIAQAASLAAHAAADIVPPVLNAASVAAYAATDAVVTGLQTSKAIKDDCQDNTFQEAITTKVDAVPGLISTSTSTTAGNITTSTTTTATNITKAKTAIIDNDDANRVTIVNNDNANLVTILNKIEAAKTYIVTDAHANKDEMKNLLLRTQIEADLASTDGSTFVALYQTPSSICGKSLNDKGLPQLVTLPGADTVTISQCGLLDLVSSIVRDTIVNIGAGTNAQSFFATAEAHRTAGRYKQAYASYRMAYKAASK
ncbi:MAG TPA: hypothetical protein VF556_09760 [Pyrinomonadaceae bacterium]